MGKSRRNLHWEVHREPGSNPSPSPSLNLNSNPDPYCAQKTIRARKEQDSTEEKEVAIPGTSPTRHGPDDTVFIIRLLVQNIVDE